MTSNTDYLHVIRSKQDGARRISIFIPRCGTNRFYLLTLRKIESHRSVFKIYPRKHCDAIIAAFLGKLERKERTKAKKKRQRIGRGRGRLAVPESSWYFLKDKGKRKIEQPVPLRSFLVCRSRLFNVPESPSVPNRLERLFFRRLCRESRDDCTKRTITCPRLSYSRKFFIWADYHDWAHSSNHTRLSYIQRWIFTYRFCIHYTEKYVLNNNPLTK